MWRVIAKNWTWEMKKWLRSPLKIHLVAKNSKCFISAAGKDISKIFVSIIIIFQHLSHMLELAKSMTSGYKILKNLMIIDGLTHTSLQGKNCRMFLISVSHITKLHIISNNLNKCASQWKELTDPCDVPVKLTKLSNSASCPYSHTNMQ